ncbi:hypothetical protein COCMIDRAFT_26768 [Bipolaris oryzae ATCC 44560]|uniref:Uncharacterized protein n=1 Tax=Bipolaris oryzae ATCC 44560 TaxID=930090 RepID=W6ZC40_COCMI|nr:uncharacterized protein COCMIDRAFT_26768 [Bipolaris oryzae ATCC 44560]EUC45004.1 hypothetical protein COCMIDRAFT_26768 [Bipolaris oryzae ATCC 44560]
MSPKRSRQLPTPSPTPSPSPHKPNTGGTWFLQFAPFTYDTTAGLKSNFERLANTRNWHDKLRQKRWHQCQAAEFDAAYGKDISKLEAWQALCREVLIEDVPGSITQCKAVLGSRNVLVNLVNLIDHRNMGTPVIRFKSYAAFRSYTTGGRVFPKKKAKEEGFIKALLRTL